MQIEVTKDCEKEVKKLNKKYHSFKRDFANFLLYLEENPYLGTPIENDCYKVRLRITSKNKGKSGLPK